MSVVVIADLIVLVEALPLQEAETKLLSQLPSPKVTGLSSSPPTDTIPLQKRKTRKPKVIQSGITNIRAGGRESKTLPSHCYHGLVSQTCVAPSSTNPSAGWRHCFKSFAGRLVRVGSAEEWTDSLSPLPPLSWSSTCARWTSSAPRAHWR